MTSTAYLIAAFSLSARAARIIKALMFQDVPSSVNLLSDMISPYASLSRFVLSAGVAVTLKEAVDRGGDGDYGDDYDAMNEPSVIAMNCLSCLCSLSVAVPLLLFDRGGMRSTTPTSDAIKLIMISILTGYHGVSRLLLTKTKTKRRRS